MKKPFAAHAVAALTATGMLFVATAAQAQTSTQSSGTGSSGRMWGAVGSSNSPVDSSTMHTLDANAAALVNAARIGLLLNNGSTTSITAIGSQNIVSTTVIGDNNSTSVNTTQSSSNTGTVTNNGSIAPLQ